MKSNIKPGILFTALILATITAGGLIARSVFAQPASTASATSARADYTDRCNQGIVQCANLIYGRNKSSVCFADEFLLRLHKDSNIITNRRFCPVKLSSDELFQYPFAVMTGESSFSLSESQRTNMRAYLQNGGFIIASAGCSNRTWDACFRSEMQKMFPKIKMKLLPMNHEIFNIVYKIQKFKTKRSTTVKLYSLELNGKVVMIYSPEGLNDTANSGPGCCCCGGNEIYNARYINANILAYALTH